ncbi:uncharacterized protein EHS24_000487 [Apiotrichum porosum]|uniref:methionine--tRNA ligase n=1 Tax=Apiotrichum porosum TaxID=105984 RepID=A0A427YAE3_9TREE|nr:uncharacterized protein EHS24_000487 [Apiotrichum porosum]RSH87964.1 hypothetical protein EHS24_000487 [Apiotrichum porosum]
MSDRNIRQAEGLLMKITNKEDGPILPVEGENNVLITSALPYVNNVPHLGNIIGSTLSADVFARYNRTLNNPTLYVCGTDEYGTATETKALEEGITPLELTTKFNKLHTEVYEFFEIGFDQWGRTSWPEQTEVTQDIYRHIHKNGFMQLETADQTYCEDDKLFLADRFVEGTCPQCGYDDARGDQCDKCGLTFSSPTELKDPRCKRNKNHKLSVRPSTHSCIRLNAIQPQLEEWMQAQRAKAKWGTNAVITEKGEIVEPRMRDGLRPSAVTRDLKWGVKVPSVGDAEEDAKLADKVIYVWFDAPIGYISMTKAYTDKWQQWWMNPENVQLYQFMGKDNVYFHTVLFPSMLIADGRNWTKLHNISSTQYLNYEDTKFSKSRGIGVFGNNAAQTGQPASVWRYYLLSQRPETGDTSFQWSKFIAAVNNELLANLGNFINRAIKFVNAKYDSVVPGPAGFEGGEVKIDVAAETSDYAKLDAEFVADVNTKLAEYREFMHLTKLRQGLQTAMSISARGNQYLQDSGLDNALFANQPERCGQVLLNAVNLIYLLSALFHPFMPTASAGMIEQLNAPARSLPTAFSIDILPGHKLGKAAHLFKRIDNTNGEQEAKWQKQFGGFQDPTSEAAAASIAAANGKATPPPKGAADHKANWAQSQNQKKKAAAAAVDAAKSPEERELETKLEAQTKIVKEIRLGRAEGDVEKETAQVKSIKSELAELRKKLKAAKISA